MDIKTKIKQWADAHSYHADDSDILFVKRLRSIGLDDWQILSILDTIDATCLHCFDDEFNCMCWDDT